ncbi:MAG: hypothetical protein AAGI53_14345 [Planctomycetota bacterium]
MPRKTRLTFAFKCQLRTWHRTCVIPSSSTAAREVPAELASVIGYEKPRSLCSFVGRILYQLRQIVRTWPVPEHLQGDDLAREASNDRSDLDVFPEHAQRRDVEMPHLMRLGGMLGVARRLRSSVARWLPPLVSRRLFLQNAPNRRSANLDACSHDVTGAAFSSR